MRHVLLVATALCLLQRCLLAQQLPLSAQQRLSELSAETIVADLTTFEALGTKLSGSQACTNTAHWLEQTYRALGYDSVMRSALPRLATGMINSDSVFNVSCFKPGTAASPFLIILCAHYDTRGGPGVNDNGSGTVALLNIARLLATLPTRNNVLFLHVSGEEQGLVGSSHFVNTLTRSTATQTRLIMNLDMIGGAKGMDNSKRVFAYNPDLAQPLRSRIQAYCDTMVTLTKAHTRLNTHSGPPGGLSDTEVFTQSGMIAFGMHMTETPMTMHTARDNMASLDTASAIEAVRAAAVAALYMAGTVEVVTTRPLTPAAFSPLLAHVYSPVMLNGRRLTSNAAASIPIIRVNGSPSLSLTYVGRQR